MDFAGPGNLDHFLQEENGQMIMTPRRYELTDFEWSVIEALPPNKPRGVPRADGRRLLNGIYWRSRKLRAVAS